MAGRNMIGSIIHSLDAKYGISAVVLTQLPIGADMNGSVSKAETQSSQSCFVKMKRGHRYDMSVAILALLQAFMSECREIILHLLERVEALSQKIQEQSPEFMLCHSEIHGGNVLIGESGSIALPNIITCDICARIL